MINRIQSITHTSDDIFELRCLCNFKLDYLDQIFSEFTNREWLVTSPNPHIDILSSCKNVDRGEYLKYNNPIILGISTIPAAQFGEIDHISNVIKSIRSQNPTDNLALYWDCESMIMYFMGQYGTIISNFDTKSLIVKKTRCKSTYSWMED
jgi:hypothetical protein